MARRKGTLEIFNPHRSLIRPFESAKTHAKGRHCGLAFQDFEAHCCQNRAKLLIKSFDSDIIKVRKDSAEGGSAMQITATELKMNMGKYLSMASRQDIFITKNGQRIAKLTNPSPDRVAMLDSLVGIAKAENVSLEDIKRERLDNA